MPLRAYAVSDWGFFRFHGPDVRAFLQGLLTADVNALVPGAMMPFCLLTPKGLLVADGELYLEAPDTVLAVVRPAAAEGFAASFEKRVMLSRSTIERLRTRAWLVFGGDPARGLPWTRLAEPARLWLGADPPHDAPLLSPEEFHALRAAAGFPWFGVDMDAATLPLEARQEPAISLTKGCYMGQETVSRIVHRGHVNRRLLRLRFEGDAPAAGAPVLREGAEVGRVTTAAGPWALAMVRAEAAEGGLSAGGVPAAPVA